MSRILITDRALKLSSNATELAESVISALDRNEKIVIDFAAVETITPSFSNALILCLLEKFSLEKLRSDCEFANRSDFVIATMNKSVIRYQCGARLLPKRAIA